MSEIVPIDMYPFLQGALFFDMFPVVQEVVTGTVIIFGTCAVAYAILQILSIMLKVSSFKFFNNYQKDLEYKKWK